MEFKTTSINEYQESMRQSNAAPAMSVSDAITRLEKANWYLSNVLMHPEQWWDHEDAINFAKAWVFLCAQTIADRTH